MIKNNLLKKNEKSINLIKVIYKKITASMILNCEILKVFPQSGNRTRMPPSSALLMNIILVYQPGY